LGFNRHALQHLATLLRSSLNVVLNQILNAGSIGVLCRSGKNPSRWPQ